MATRRKLDRNALKFNVERNLNGSAEDENLWVVTDFNGIEVAEYATKDEANAYAKDEWDMAIEDEKENIEEEYQQQLQDEEDERREAEEDERRELLQKLESASLDQLRKWARLVG